MFNLNFKFQILVRMTFKNWNLRSLAEDQGVIFINDIQVRLLENLFVIASTVVSKL